MKYLVIGASGMVGHLVGVYLSERGNEVVGYSRRPAPVIRSVSGDLYDLEKLRDLIDVEDFDAIVNAAGLLVADCENRKDSAVFINAYIPNLLAEWTKGTRCKVVQLSTDCVFAGNTGPYTEDSVPDGTEYYSIVKHAGELRDEKNVTLRNSVVGPDINERGIGLLNWFMKQDGVIDGWDRAIWTGLTSLELAKAVEYVVENNCSGLVNLVPDGPGVSKHDLLQLFNRYLRGGRADIRHTDYFVSDKTLKRTNYEIPYSVPSYEEMVAEMAEWISSHADLYPSFYYPSK